MVFFCFSFKQQRIRKQYSSHHMMFQNLILVLILVRWAMDICILPSCFSPIMIDCLKEVAYILCWFNLEYPFIKHLHFHKQSPFNEYWGQFLEKLCWCVGGSGNECLVLLTELITYIHVHTVLCKSNESEFRWNSSFVLTNFQGNFERYFAIFLQKFEALSKSWQRFYVPFLIPYYRKLMLHEINANSKYSR